MADIIVLDAHRPSPTEEENPDQRDEYMPDMHAIAALALVLSDIPPWRWSQEQYDEGARLVVPWAAILVARKQAGG